MLRKVCSNFVDNLSIVSDVEYYETLIKWKDGLWGWFLDDFFFSSVFSWFPFGFGNSSYESNICCSCFLFVWVSFSIYVIGRLFIYIFFLRLLSCNYKFCRKWVKCFIFVLFLVFFFLPFFFLNFFWTSFDLHAKPIQFSRIIANSWTADLPLIVW